MEAEVDAIVNPTDLVLSGGGGLDFVIRQAAGEEVDQACTELAALGEYPSVAALVVIS